MVERNKEYNCDYCKDLAKWYIEGDYFCEQCVFCGKRTNDIKPNLSKKVVRYEDN